jgi:hypothetical protein
MSFTVIVGLLLLSGFIIPAFIVIQKQRSEKKKLEQFLTEFEQHKNIRISEHETWKNKIIGVDYDSRKALFIIRDKTHNESQIIELNGFSGCSVEKTMIISEEDSSIQAVDAIRLRFKPRDKSHPDQLFSLFVEEEDQNLGAELRIAEAWAVKFNTSIKKLAKAA